MGLVVIGRNEGERLRRCLMQAVQASDRVVYVDSGSHDGSPAFARRIGINVVDLDMNKPFSAARARNRGFEALAWKETGTEYVQFVDADCELESRWIATAVACLNREPNVAAVCGELVEKEPDATIYNRLCQLEWKSLPGETDHCGGIFMVRSKAFDAVGGFNERVIAGEEPELCVRLQRAGWKMWRLPVPMARHDAAMTHFGQWWKRAMRGGHAYAEGDVLLGTWWSSPWRREVWRNWIWGVLLPLIMAGLAWPTGGWSIGLGGLYVVWIIRIATRRRGQFKEGWRDAILYATFCMIGKMPQALGQMLYWWRRWRGSSGRLIEYKLSKSSEEALLR